MRQTSFKLQQSIIVISIITLNMKLFRAIVKVNTYDHARSIYLYNIESIMFIVNSA